MDDLVERLRSTKPEEPSWWMIERDDLSFRPAYLAQTYLDGLKSWTPDWSNGFRFHDRAEAERFCAAHYVSDGVVRSHSMMTGYHNPDGPEAADRIEKMEAENARLREAAGEPSDFAKALTGKLTEAELDEVERAMTRATLSGNRGVTK